MLIVVLGQVLRSCKVHGYMHDCLLCALPPPPIFIMCVVYPIIVACGMGYGLTLITLRTLFVVIMDGLYNIELCALLLCCC